MNGSKGRLRRAAEEPARGGVLETAVTCGGRRAVLGGDVDDVTCSDELVRVRLHGVDEGGG
jgi:hypothetical protein